MSKKVIQEGVINTLSSALGTHVELFLMPLGIIQECKSGGEPRYTQWQSAIAKQTSQQALSLQTLTRLDLAKNAN